MRYNPLVHTSLLASQQAGVGNKIRGKMSMSRTIFEYYGGFAKVSKVVSSFYEKMLDSPVTSLYFTNTDMRTLIDHQTKFIAYLMGGPASYTNDHLERVHDRLGITEAAFVEAVLMLKETLEDMDFEDQDIRTIEERVLSTKNFIIRRS
jgi:hemoglobin